MKSTIIKGKELSGMTLGTVQLGMNYGIANDLGQPDEKKSHSMLSAAKDNGITSIDTARAYGNSEDVLGTFLKAEEKTEELFITSKFIIGLPADVPKRDVEKAMYKSVET